PLLHLFCHFFFNDPPTSEISPLSLHDALPISPGAKSRGLPDADDERDVPAAEQPHQRRGGLGPLPSEAAAAHGHLPAQRLQMERSEEHTSELQSLTNLVCRLLLEKKKNTSTDI